LLPISIDLGRVRVLLIGNGAAARRRLALLDEAGAKDLHIYAPAPAAELANAAGERLRRRLPEPDDLAGAHLVFIADLPEPEAGALRSEATRRGALVNIEDDPARCDFHSAAVLRRGDLTIAVSTNGKAPGLAAAVRRDLEQRLGPEWQQRLEQLAALRAEWRQEGTDSSTIAVRTAEWYAAQVPS